MEEGTHTTRVKTTHFSNQIEQKEKTKKKGTKEQKEKEAQQAGAWK